MCKRRAVTILNSAGGSFTSRSRALKYVRSGRARYIDEQTIRMIEDDPRHLAVVASIEEPHRDPAVVKHSPRPYPVIPFEEDAFLGQTYLQYPQRPQITLPRAA